MMNNKLGTKSINSYFDNKNRRNLKWTKEYH
jgi:ribosomal protein L24E